MTATLTVEEIELIQLAMECLYSELPEYDSINEKLRIMRAPRDTNHGSVSMTINWDKAPEGATHYNSVTKGINPWLKEHPLSFWVGNEWLRYDPPSIGLQHIAAAVPKPLAEVGTTLEYWYAEGDCWSKGEVIAHAKGKVVVMGSEDDGVGLYTSAQIRRLKTATELAQEKKEDEIVQMRRIVVKATLEGVDPVEALHEAGARVIVDAW